MVELQEKQSSGYEDPSCWHIFTAGFSNLAGARRKSLATSSICAGYFSSFLIPNFINYTILFHKSNRDLIFSRK